MADKNNKKTTIKELYDNKLLISKIDAMIDQKATLQYMADFAKSYGFDVSLNTIRSYKSKRQESIEKGIPLVELLDRRRKQGNIVELAPKEEQDNTDISLLEQQAGVQSELPKDDTDKLVTSLQFVEKIINKAAKSINEADFVDPQLGLKAVDLHNKMVGASAGGITLHGMQELRIQNKAFESAVQEVMMEYIPEDQWDEVLTKMDEKREEFISSLDVDEERRRIKKQLEEAGI